MTHVRTFRSTVTFDRSLQVPDNALTVGAMNIVSSPSNPQLDEGRAVRRADRTRLAGELEGRIQIADDAFAPLTEEELEVWYSPLDPYT